MDSQEFSLELYFVNSLLCLRVPPHIRNYNYNLRTQNILRRTI